MSAQPVGPADEHGVIELPASEARSRISELLDAVASGEMRGAATRIPASSAVPATAATARST